MMLNPYYRNPFYSNPLLSMMMQIQMQPMNAYDGNGLLHPVYISPLMMHQLEESVPPWKDPNYDNAKEGNMDCVHGATVSCTDSGKKIKTVDAFGQLKIKEAQIPEKVSCFAGCADMNPCNTNLYSSFVQSEHSCDGSGFFYYTCEAFEELEIFLNACERHEAGAKVDVPITTMKTTSKYKKWKAKVMHNREEGKGREIMYDDDSIEPGMGVSVGEGNRGKSPISDEALGNVLDTHKYITDPDLAKQEAYSDDIALFYDENDGQEMNIKANVFGAHNDRNVAHHHDTLEVIIVSIWGILFSVLVICCCCAMAAFCGWTVNKIRRKMRKKNNMQIMYRDINNSDEEEEDIERQIKHSSDDCIA